MHTGPGPQRRYLCTVLRSPHVNKKSREQFMERTHTRFFLQPIHHQWPISLWLLWNVLIFQELK